MAPPTTTALDDAFADDLDEIVERVLYRYRPIFSHLVTGRLRSELRRSLLYGDALRPWLARSQSHPVHGIGSLTAGQVALLGGTRPTRVLGSLAAELGLRLDGGDERGQREADLLLCSSFDAVQSVVEHYPIAPLEGREAPARRLRELVRLCVAAQIAAMMGALQEHLPGSASGELEELPELVQRYFRRALQAFGRIRLSRRDQDIFREHYLEAGDLEEIADERGLGLDAEIERRLGFLKRLATAIEAHVDLLTGAARPPGAETAGALGGAERDASQPRALTRATGRAARPRRR